MSERLVSCPLRLVMWVVFSCSSSSFSCSVDALVDSVALFSLWLTYVFVFCTKFGFGTGPFLSQLRRFIVGICNGCALNFGSVKGKIEKGFEKLENSVD